MFDVDIKFEDICVNNIEEEDLSQLREILRDKKFYLNDDELREIYLECYMSECEIFTKILKKGKFIGVFRGRIEFKSSNMIWISYFYINNKYSLKKSNQDILMNILDYFSRNFGVCDFITGVTNSEKDMIDMWKNNDFRTVRINKEFYSDKDYKEDLMIMKKYNSI
ncbi:GNAT family N-acetyltransferase [Clostridium felsineum]|uniref:GNAT family N-acetyltransferase n=1 Tax=Clostridium felsineum TaxID=36839 RepID=UPI00214D8086|nr:GNAT family N-acetyltransferase [Clostridium felsineum]MCR3758246.1 GNAT family N-acetyltransferase [Clostridium felsineum]